MQHLGKEEFIWPSSAAEQRPMAVLHAASSRPPAQPASRPAPSWGQQRSSSSLSARASACARSSGRSLAASRRPALSGAESRPGAMCRGVSQQAPPAGNSIVRDPENRLKLPQGKLGAQKRHDALPPYLPAHPPAKNYLHRTTPPTLLHAAAIMDIGPLMSGRCKLLLAVEILGRKCV